uniref:Uncharacterized protein n=1 Tax=Rhizophora mucronata TaxID=61149 RepID=A0A2P2L7F0_RHIMU
MSDCVVDPFVCCNRKRAKTPIFSNLLTRQVSCGYSGTEIVMLTASEGVFY